ncbi:acyl-CoA dehydrogenase family protein [Chengkuizengella axinellae]|uniref:Acyl-CoA dehydrogenase family protein n=1 Tax=Chengkuizengella axinellae TaxID=3064388 RepID=A0ABT9IU54_9BACL|nr:acyl-CoA dehydrogenase family protein [Chengkuizengella sp. 2205SS18-9]MDP5272827.1 acyl-CoA dehydrogenase family protein [Chengkuizengella sp. 2205SS18-9]
MTKTAIDIEEMMYTLDDIIVDYISPNAANIDRTGIFPRQNISLLAEEGFLGLLIPKELGGCGATPSIYKEVVIKLAKACASTAMVFVQHVSATSIMLHGAHQPFIQQQLRSMASGQSLATIALSEPGSGVYFFMPVSQMIDGEHEDFIFSAKKSMVTSAGEADIYVSNSRSTSSTSALQSNYFIFRKDQEGVEIGGIWEGMGLRGNNSAPMMIQNCLIPKKAMIGKEGDGFKISRERLLPMGQIGISSIHVGITKAMYEECVKYVKKRYYEHSDTHLSSFQSIQQMMAEMRIECDRAEGALKDMVTKLESGDIDMVTILEIKVIACEAAGRVANLCLRVAGGHAYSSHLPLERYIRDSKAGTVLGPTPDVLKELIGKIILDVPKTLI